jgi:hypothetical protein
LNVNILSIACVFISKLSLGSLAIESTIADDDADGDDDTPLI